MLTWFGEVSNYKANASKSSILDIGIEAVTCNLLQHQFLLLSLNRCKHFCPDLFGMGKKSRCAHHKLIKHRLYGGVGYVDFQDYFSASILTQVREWFNSTPTTQWGHIESNYCKHGPANLWLLGALLGVKILTHLPTTMVVSIKTWLKLLASTDLTDQNVSVKIPFQVLHLIIDHVLIDSWSRKGIKFIHDLYTNGSLRSFQSVKSEFDLPHTSYFQYAQIGHCLQSLGNFCQHIHTLAWTSLTSPVHQKKGISLFYNLLQQNQTFTKSSSHLIWEQDLQHSFTLDQWHVSCKANQSASKCTSLWELSVKITLRWYLTPVVLSKFDSHTSNTCWRLCSAKGDMIHILWSCPKLITYWTKIFNIISDLTQTQVPLDPALALLSLGIYKFPPNLRSTITHLLLAARLSITRKWKDYSPLTASDAIDLTNLHNTYERILASSLGSLHTYTKHWAPWNFWYDDLA